MSRDVICWQASYFHGKLGFFGSEICLLELQTSREHVRGQDDLCSEQREYCEHAKHSKNQTVIFWVGNPKLSDTFENVHFSLCLSKPETMIPPFFPLVSWRYNLKCSKKYKQLLWCPHKKKGRRKQWFCIQYCQILPFSVPETGLLRGVLKTFIPFQSHVKPF